MTVEGGKGRGRKRGIEGGEGESPILIKFGKDKESLKKIHISQRIIKRMINAEELLKGYSGILKYFVYVIRAIIYKKKKLTRITFAKLFYRSRHFLLGNTFILLSLSCCF